MKTFKLLFILAILSGPVAFAADQVNCNQELSNNSQIFQLMALVKNEVLGTVPKFCRVDGHEQLAEKNDPGEKALSDFVGQLKKLNPNGKDTLNYDFGKKEEVQNVIFNTFKMVILKKMWQQSGPDNQYSLLLSEQCSEVGLNRFPIQKGSVEFEKNIEKDKEKALSAAKRVCSTIEFDALAPFVTKDVLAEALLNLKNVFPASFPKLVDSLCLSLNSQNDLLWKNDSYDSFARPKISLNSSKDFSAWLKGLYEDIANKDKLAAEKDKQDEVLQKADEYDGGPSQYSVAPFKEEQQYLQQMFKQAQKGKVEKNSIPYPENENLLLKKNSKGIFIIVPTKKVEKKIKEEQDSFNSNVIASVNEDYKQTQESLQEVYEAGQDPKGKVVKQVPLKGFPGFFVVKNKDGTYAYVLDEAGKAEVEKVKNKQQEKLKSPELQSQLKTMYELQQKYVDEDGKNYFPEDYGVTLIEKLPDGSYAMKGPKNTIPEKAVKDMIIKLSANKTEMPIPSDYPGYVKIKTIDGIYDSVAYVEQKKKKHPVGIFGVAQFEDEEEVANDMYKNEENENSETYDPYEADAGPKSEITANLSEQLNSNIRRRFQGKSSDNSKFDQLSTDEVAQLRSYTGNSFTEINTCLRESNCDEAQTKRVNSIISGLQKLKNNNANPDKYSSEDSQVLFRGAREVPDFVKAGLNKNAEHFVLDKGFMSSTGDINVARGFSGGEGGYVFVMKTKSCVGISSISHFDHEDEFLCPPGMKFKVSKKVGSEGVYIMEEESK